LFDWSSHFTYTLLAAIVLFGIGIYAIISGKKFIQMVIGIELLFLAINLLFLSIQTDGDLSTLRADPLAQTIAIMIIIIGAAFAIIGFAINKHLRKIGKSATVLTFNFAAAERTNIENKEE
jgi:NADH:ubiquinone oxidoreductase subunit K